MNPTIKNIAMYGLLTITLVATYYTSQQTPDEIETAEPAEAAQSIKPSQLTQSDNNQLLPEPVLPSSVLPNLAKPAMPILENNANLASNEKTPDLFAAHSWYVPPPAPKVAKLPPALQPKPVAPEVPFTYFGKVDNTPKGTLILLMQGKRLLNIPLSQNVDALWRLDKEDRNNLYFTYLPLNQEKVVSKAAKNGVAQDNAEPPSEQFTPEESI